MDLLRDIMKAVIEYEGPEDIHSTDLHSEGVSPETMAFHVGLLVDAGCLKALDASSKDGRCYMCLEPTLHGQMFLDTIENQGVWNKIKKYMMENGIEFSIKAILSVASRFIP